MLEELAQAKVIQRSIMPKALNIATQKKDNTHKNQSLMLSETYIQKQAMHAKVVKAYIYKL